MKQRVIGMGTLAVVGALVGTIGGAIFDLANIAVYAGMGTAVGAAIGVGFIRKRCCCGCGKNKIEPDE